VTPPRISIVTVSFNQRPFLAAAIESVLNQQYANLEYIVVDPGSTDGSRDVIRRYASRIDHVVFEKDHGAAEGLNNGFRHATGELFGFVNADDVLFPGALRTVASAARSSDADVLSGHCMMMDAHGRATRTSHSDRFSLKAIANGGCVLMQPSTFFRASLFWDVGGFNAENRSNWDAELWIDMALHGAKFAVIPATLSGYRLYPGTITASPDARKRYREHQLQWFSRIMGRPPGAFNGFTRLYYQMRRYALCPAAIRERVFHGRLMGR
jgi:glycosyltransferase involved in cell wall biosynthesis